jgi:hypothetical protein
MKQIWNTVFSLLLSGTILLSASGCGKSEKGTVRDVSDGTTETTVTTEPVSLHDGNVGEEFSSQEVYVTIDNAYLSDYTFTLESDERQLVFFQITIRNESEEDVSANILSHSYAIKADGALYDGVTIRCPRFVLKQFGEDVEDFTEDIAPGETRQGYLCMEVPSSFSNLTLLYYPAAGLLDWSDAYTFDFERSELQNAGDPVDEF